MTKTRTAKTVVCAAVCMLSLASIADEHVSETQPIPTVSDGPTLGINVSSAFMSKYIWRGQLLNDDYVFQPSVGASYGNWSASWWGNMDFTGYHKDNSGNDNSGEFTEHDWTISYADKIPELDFLKYSVGAIYYYFPSVTDDADTVEIYAGLGLEMPLSPTLTMYRDIDEIDGTYMAFSVSHSIDSIFELSPDMPVGVTASASIGWGSASYNKGYWANADDETKSVTSSSMQDLTVSVGFPVVVLGWTVTPSVSYVTLLDSDVREADTYRTSGVNNDSDYFFTGLSLSRSF